MEDRGGDGEVVKATGAAAPQRESGVEAALRRGPMLSRGQGVMVGQFGCSGDKFGMERKNRQGGRRSMAS
jgi:hypothetical protein